MTSAAPRGLCDVLACPTCRGGVRPAGDGLACRDCGRRFPIVRGVPVLLPEGVEPLPQDAALGERSGYDDWIPRSVLDALPPDAIAVEVGAGNMAASRPNVLRLDVTLSPHVDVVGDAHALPFRSGALDLVFSHAVLEHLRQPFAAAEEMQRVLRPGGYVYAECAFVFPFHGHPHHYFNASHLGLAELFRGFTALRAGVAPYQMPSFALRAVLETYLFFLSPHEDAAARHVRELVSGVLHEDLSALDDRFSQEAALRVAACTYYFGVKTPEATAVVPAALLETHRRSAALRERFPSPLDLGSPDNLLTWARSDEGRRVVGPAELNGRPPFRKDAPLAAREQAEATPALPGGWLARARRGARRLTGRNGHGTTSWAVEEIIDDGERVTHLFPNDCYVAHLSIYHFAAASAADKLVLDAGSGSGYGAAYLAEHGARLVQGYDASPKAVAFSREHFTRPNLRYDVRRLEALDGLEPGIWDVVVCSNVLEHVARVDRVLDGVRRLLRPTGVFLLAVPPVVNEALRAQNLANPYHVNIWSPRQWAHALAGYFDDVQTLQHWYDKPGVELNLVNSPADTVITPGDFVFRPVPVDDLYGVPTISAVFAARAPRATARVPANGSRIGFVDDSFTRPAPPGPASWPVRVWRRVAAR